MNIRIFSVLRKINRYNKLRKKALAGRIISPVRRIERVSPPAQRVCAMTFDDGPTAAPCIPSGKKGGLTAHLLDVLKSYGARATFDVIGSTAENYPDVKGEKDNHLVFGVKYDHYACFEQDALAGAEACGDLIRRMVEEGHEIANHGYRHRIFGPEYFVYRNRVFQKSLDEVVADLTRLHELIKGLTGYEIKLSRPPHYVDRIGFLGQRNAYTAYAVMGYHYMAASADGGGWLPSTGDYRRDVELMTEPLAAMLRENPDSLSGAVIFQKDGYNMSIQSPIADALEPQLKLLEEYGYRVVGVEELMEISPFEDVPHTHRCLEAVRGLEAAGYTLGFRNNTFKPDEPVTGEQLQAMCTPRRLYTAKKITDRTPLNRDMIKRIISEKHGSCAAVAGGTRGDAAIALWGVVGESLVKPTCII